MVGNDTFVKMKTMKFAIPVLAICTLVLSACSNTPTNPNDEVDLGSFNNGVYTCKEIGWEASYPINWNITNKASLENMDKRSREAMGLEADDNNSTIKRLLAYQKDFNNNFKSYIRPFKGSESDYLTEMYALRQQLYDGYYLAGHRVDTLTGEDKIGTASFKKIEFNLYDRTGKAFQHQIVYTTLRKGYILTAEISYEEEKDKNQIVGYFKKSKFN